MHDLGVAVVDTLAPVGLVPAIFAEQVVPSAAAAAAAEQVITSGSASMSSRPALANDVPTLVRCVATDHVVTVAADEVDTATNRGVVAARRTQGAQDVGAAPSYFSLSLVFPARSTSPKSVPVTHSMPMTWSDPCPLADSASRSTLTARLDNL